MTSYDRDEHVDNGADRERVVVRDRRRIDPVTGEVRVPVTAAEPAPPAAADPSAAEPVDERLDQLIAEVAERTADLQRVTAEYANYRRRVDRDRDAVLGAARAQFVGELLTVLDDLDRAAAHGDLTGAFKSVADKVVAVVGKLGLESFGDPGELFDPAVHEAVQHEQSAIPVADGGACVTVVSAVLRRGFRLADRVLRPAMVTVVDRPAVEVGDVDEAGAVPAGSPAPDQG